MKKTATLLLITIISANAFSKCTGHAWLWVYNDSVQVNSYTNLDTQPVNALLAPGDWVEIKIAGDLMCNSAVLFLNNADTLMSGLMTSSPVYLTLTATGHYFIQYHSTTADWTWEFDVSYYASTGLQNISEQRPFQIYPSTSDGIYKLQTTQTLKQLLIFDNEGRTIIETSNVFSDINLTRFSNGIYFYAITDENEKVWRGKLLKD